MDKFNVKKSYRDGRVGLRFAVRDRNVRIDGGSDLSAADARKLAAELIAEADRADAKVAAKKASDERHQKWRDREIAAGRMRVISFRELQRT